MDPKLLEIQKLLDAADGNLSSARTMMRELTAGEAAPLDMEAKLGTLNAPEEGKVIEGVFDGESMTGPDGQSYPVPSNYASKSKLVEGDTLKLTISDDGSFIFKQIAPVERRNAVGTLALDNGNYTISSEGKSYKVLTASVTFYKAEPGDQVTIVLPKEHDAVWAVLENVIKKATESNSLSSPAEAQEPEILRETQNDITEVPHERVIPVTTEPTAAEATPTVDEILAEPQVPEAAPQPETKADTPEIEFPAGPQAVSDEQLLENLKNNLKNIETPAFTPPEAATHAAVAPRNVDNIVATDLAQMDNKPQDNVDKPISELDI